MAELRSADAGQPDVSSLLHIGAHVSLRSDDGFVVTLDPEKLCALERTDEPPRHFQIRCVFVVHPQRSHRPGHTGHGHEKRVNEAEFARSQGMVVKYGDVIELVRVALGEETLSLTRRTAAMNTACSRAVPRRRRARTRGSRGAASAFTPR